MTPCGVGGLGLVVRPGGAECGSAEARVVADIAVTPVALAGREVEHALARCLPQGRGLARPPEGSVRTQSTPTSPI